MKPMTVLHHGGGTLAPNAAAQSGRAASSPRPTAHRESWPQLHQSLPIDGCLYSVAPTRWDRRSGPARGRRLKLNVCEVIGPQDHLGLLAADPRIGATACQDGEDYRYQNHPPCRRRARHGIGTHGPNTHTFDHSVLSHICRPLSPSSLPCQIGGEKPRAGRSLLVGGGMIRGHLGNAARPTLLSWYTPRCVATEPTIHVA